LKLLQVQHQQLLFALLLILSEPFLFHPALDEGNLPPHPQQPVPLESHQVQSVMWTDLMLPHELPFQSAEAYCKRPFQAPSLQLVSDLSQPVYLHMLPSTSQDQKQKKQEAIMQKEKEAADLKKKYFGPDGELFKKRESLMAPIQDEIYNTVKEVAELRGYQMVLDRASDGAGIIFASPRIDISNEVLQKLGY
jgi:hypothetical protein